jgi:hypothetical protein
MSSKRQDDGDEDEDDDGLLDDDDDSDEQEPPVKKRKKISKSFIDDAAEESGEEEDDEDDEDDEDNVNEYVKDGFVVDEEDVERKKRDDLEDSDDDDEDEDEDDEIDDDEEPKGDEARKKRLKKVRKMRQLDRLDDEDLALIQEAQQDDDEEMMPVTGPEPPERERVVARSEAELRKGLFRAEEEEEGDESSALRERKPVRVERYDEDGMDDFIDDDIGDQGAIMASERRGGLFDDATREVSEAQLHEASEIFGTDYLEFMADDHPDQDEEELMGKYREPGVGIDLGESDEDVVSDDDDDLFGDDDDDDDDMDGSTALQKKEVLRLKREKRRLAKEERRRQALEKKSDRRKAQLRRAFEPVQLVENFCTDRDDDIRQKDIPERFYDWKTPFLGSEQDGMNEDEREEAEWIVERIPQIAAEFATHGENAAKKDMVLESITNALRFMHFDKLEPAFIKHYRRDYVTSLAVRENLYSIMDEDTEWDRLINARQKVEGLLAEITHAADSLVSRRADLKKITDLESKLAEAERLLEETAAQETQMKHELEALGAADEDDDDELFGDEDDDDVSLFTNCALYGRRVGFADNYSLSLLL